MDCKPLQGAQMRILLSSYVIVALFAGCTSVTSETLNNTQIEAIQDRVEERHPNLSSSQQTAITELVVRAVGNMVFVEGGSFMMGEFGVPCEPGSKDLCNADFSSDNDYAHKGALDDYYLSKFETTLSDFDLYRESMGRTRYAPELREREDRQHLY